jgi:uncharacterized protein (DUF1697 family)
MPRFVVLLRGVNVGKGNRLPMAEFRAVLESLGATRVRTLLNSGNAVLSHKSRSPGSLGRNVHGALLAGCGLDLQVVVLSSAEFAGVIEQNPISIEPGEHSRLLAIFAQGPESLQELSALAPLVRPPERFVTGELAGYLHCPDGILESKAANALLGKAGKSVTTRNWATVLKLAQLLFAND